MWRRWLEGGCPDRRAPPHRGCGEGTGTKAESREDGEEGQASGLLNYDFDVQRATALLYLLLLLLVLLVLLVVVAVVSVAVSAVRIPRVDQP